MFFSDGLVSFIFRRKMGRTCLLRGKRVGKVCFSRQSSLHFNALMMKVLFFSLTVTQCVNIYNSRRGEEKLYIGETKLLLDTQKVY